MIHRSSMAVAFILMMKNRKKERGREILLDETRKEDIMRPHETFFNRKLSHVQNLQHHLSHSSQRSPNSPLRSCQEEGRHRSPCDQNCQPHRVPQPAGETNLGAGTQRWPWWLYPYEALLQGTAFYFQERRLCNSQESRYPILKGIRRKIEHGSFFPCPYANEGKQFDLLPVNEQSLIHSHDSAKDSDRSANQRRK